MLVEDQHRRVVAHRRRSADQIPYLLIPWVRLSRQNPQVASRRFSDDGPAVIIGVVENPIVAVEWAEEAYLQLGVRIRVDDSRYPARLFESAIPFAAPIHDVDLAIRSLRVVRSRGLAASLEGLVVARDFIPTAKIAFEVDRL